MVPQVHNIHIVRGEPIIVDIGYNVEVTADELFACIREHPSSDTVLAKFAISVNKDDLQPGDSININMVAETSSIKLNKVHYDLFIWSGHKPIKCLLRGKIFIHDSVSDRGKDD